MHHIYLIPTLLIKPLYLLIFSMFLYEKNLLSADITFHSHHQLGPRRRRQDGGRAGPAGGAGLRAGRLHGPQGQGQHLRLGLGQRRQVGQCMQLIYHERPTYEL